MCEKSHRLTITLPEEPWSYNHSPLEQNHLTNVSYFQFQPLPKEIDRAELRYNVD
jgi:hypothetical protein